ncbi:MAG: leucine-rich repeat domain-containing protein, partial [Ureaplasma sp.]|nr:leucine-rich repeat domain-containing protein [Ureaplasma sp.]
ISSFAFNNCSSLTSIKIPNSVNEILANTFADCSKLDYVIIPNSISTINRLAFSNTQNVKLYVPTLEAKTKVEEFNIDNITVDNIIVGLPTK